MGLEFHKLIVYRKIREYNQFVHKLLRKVAYRDAELADQLRRTGNSAQLNTAEGAAESRPRAKANFYEIAKRSMEEAGAAWERAADQNYITMEELHSITPRIVEIATMLTKMIRRFRT